MRKSTRESYQTRREEGATRPDERKELPDQTVKRSSLGRTHTQTHTHTHTNSTLLCMLLLPYVTAIVLHLLTLILEHVYLLVSVRVMKSRLSLLPCCEARPTVHVNPSLCCGISCSAWTHILVALVLV